MASDYRKETVLRMAHLTPAGLAGLQRTFPLYVKFPKSRWEEIRRAEAFTPEGTLIYEALAEEYRARFMA